MVGRCIEKRKEEKREEEMKMRKEAIYILFCEDLQFIVAAGRCT